MTDSIVPNPPLLTQVGELDIAEVETFRSLLHLPPYGGGVFQAYSAATTVGIGQQLWCVPPMDTVDVFLDSNPGVLQAFSPGGGALPLGSNLFWGNIPTGGVGLSPCVYYVAPASGFYEFGINALIAPFTGHSFAAGDQLALGFGFNPGGQPNFIPGSFNADPYSIETKPITNANQSGQYIGHSMCRGLPADTIVVPFVYGHIAADPTTSLQVNTTMFTGRQVQ